MNSLSPSRPPQGVHSSWVGAVQKLEGRSSPPPPRRSRVKQDSISDVEEGEFQDDEVMDVPQALKGREVESLRSRRRNLSSSSAQSLDNEGSPIVGVANWRRILLLIVAITVHNIPGGHLLELS